MRAKDLMQTDIHSAREDDPVDDLIDIFVHEHIHGVPVLDETGALVGIVTAQDAFFSNMTKQAGPGGKGKRRGRRTLRARDVMTTPVVFATEGTTVRSLCRLMHRLRMHRVPIVRRGKLTGIVSSLDVCGAVARGEKVV